MNNKVMLVKPVTHTGRTAESLLGELVRVRPYYHVPSGPYSLASTRSPWTCEAWVAETFGTMVVVRFTNTDSVPWQRESAFYPRELHVRLGCPCPACTPLGGGLHEHYGA